MKGGSRGARGATMSAPATSAKTPQNYSHEWPCGEQLTMKKLFTFSKMNLRCSSNLFDITMNIQNERQNMGNLFDIRRCHEFRCRFCRTTEGNHGGRRWDNDI